MQYFYRNYTPKFLKAVDEVNIKGCFSMELSLKTSSYTEVFIRNPIKPGISFQII